MRNIDIVEFPISDLHFVAKWRSDKRVNRFIRKGMRTLPEVQKWYSDYFSSETNKLYSIKKDNLPIGYFTIERIDKVNRNCEFGIVIGETYFHQKGIGSFVVKTMIEKAFNQMNMHRVFAVIHEGNIASMKCFVKAGFTLEGKHREARLANGKFRDILHYSILEKEWRKST